MSIKTKWAFLTFATALTLTSCNTQLPYQNSDLSPKERAADLCSRLTIEEKAQIMMNDSKAIERLGIPQFAWWSEALHGVGRNGVATMFPQCIGMASSFDTTLIFNIYSAISDEARAKNTIHRQKGEMNRYQGLSFWTPTINIFRDPRWGRGQESYGEDPFVNAIMGKAVVNGLQGPNDHKYKKLLACAKHFAIHSGPEKTRHTFDIRDLSSRDLWETYLPAFETLVREANVAEVMCAYQRFDGEPCCGSNRLLTQILRDDWGFNGLVVSDCGAISDFWQPNHHGVSENAADASADAVLAGTDLECGSEYKNLPEAIKRGYITEEQIDVSVRRLLKARFELGNFDPDSEVEWTKIGTDVIASEAHRNLSLQMAREQMVLLQNKGNILPLSKDDDKIMVMGPNAADSLVLWGIYFGQPAHTVTMLEGIRNKTNKDIPYNKACELTALTQDESQFANFSTTDGKQGMKATYWNNEKMQGEPVTEVQYQAPIMLDNGGNTVFAPNVNLEHFTMRLSGKLTAKQTEDLIMTYSHDDGLRIIVNGDTIYDSWFSDYMRVGQKTLHTEVGQTYNIDIDYLQQTGDASFAFDLIKVKTITPTDVVKTASDAQTIIFIGGISPNLEREEAQVSAPGFDNGDRTSIELPQAQRDVLKALHKAGKKIIFVNCSGSAVALTPELETCDAIIQAWYAGEQGGAALADVIFGDYNPSGKLPVTFYASDDDLPSFDDYSMKAGKGRTYRYFTGKPLFPFGFGLSYTTFSLTNPQWDETTHSVKVTVTNTGKYDGTEIVQVYVSNPADEEGPQKTLRGFARVDVKTGESKEVSIAMPRDRFKLWNSAKGVMMVQQGKHLLHIGNSSDNVQTISCEIE